MKNDMVGIKKTASIKMVKGKYMKHLAKGKVSTKFMQKGKLGKLTLDSHLMNKKKLPAGTVVGHANVKVKLIQGKDGSLKFAIPKNAIFKGNGKGK